MFNFFKTKKTSNERVILMKRLTKLAADMFKYKYHCEATTLIDGKSPVDFAAIALCKYEDGIRNNRRNEKLADFFYNLLHNDIYRAFRKQCKHTVLDDLAENILFTLHTNENCPSEQLEVEEIIILFLQYIKEEYPHLLSMANLMIIEGYAKPQEISERLNLPIEAVNNRKKIFNRAIKSFQLLHADVLTGNEYTSFSKH